MTFHPRPSAGEPRPWAFPAPDRSVLPNGLTLLRCHRPGRQVIAVEVNVAARLDVEPEGLDGVANVMARALCEGTDRHSAEEFAAELERCGANAEAHANSFGVRLTLEVPVSRLARALGLLAEALRAPAFADAVVDRLVRNRLDEIPYELADPQRRATRALAAALFAPDDRMSRPRQGTEETVARIDSAAVRAFYEAHVRPATATAVVVGDLTGIDLDAVLADTLGTWTGNTTAALPARPTALPVKVDDTGRVVIVDRPGAVQTQLLIGAVGSDRHGPGWAAQVLGAYCLGGSLTSRLDRVLREEKGYTYGVRTFTQVLRSDPGGGGLALATISGSVDTSATGPALADIRTLLLDLSAHGLGETERDAAVENLVGVAPLRFETSSSIAGTLADQAEQDLPDDYQKQLYERLGAVDAAAAGAAVARLFSLERLVTVLVGDASRIGEQVRGLGLGDVQVLHGG
ncbi:M16 family metallopeptidase [Streptomyces sp. NPDC088748]|uniref:M16 family metallopeptidase n=1 Tax=Streptomyces sp. NPDC088748 TaxID=3365887 RepID=UPI00380FA2A3